jgi:hypothetical protein
VEDTLTGSAGTWFSLLRTPTVVAVVITAGAGLIASAMTNRINRAELELEHLKHDSAAILKTIELADGDPDTVSTNLLFLINNKIIRDPEGEMAKHLNARGVDGGAVGGPPCRSGVC